jgi:hypothetical protein
VSTRETSREETCAPWLPPANPTAESMKKLTNRLHRLDAVFKFDGLDGDFSPRPIVDRVHRQPAWMKSAVGDFGGSPSRRSDPFRSGRRTAARLPETVRTLRLADVNRNGEPPTP